MAYVIEAVVVCDGCGRSIEYTESRNKVFADAKFDLREPKVRGSGYAIPLVFGYKHLCADCREKTK
jgi:hypothetical protein